jgi:hypothetical protein
VDGAAEALDGLARRGAGQRALQRGRHVRRFAHVEQVRARLAVAQGHGGFPEQQELPDD